MTINIKLLFSHPKASSAHGTPNMHLFFVTILFIFPKI
ncbi:protein of unknown function [Rhodovastum atsumiense]|nr:protein of unknown function [Rhodovastum atsumiense]